jgi:hypothetical protein
LIALNFRLSDTSTHLLTESITSSRFILLFAWRLANRRRDRNRLSGCCLSAPVEAL